jgi:putative sigma-54 modulation protein
MIVSTRALDFPLTTPIRHRVESRVRSATEPVNGRVVIVTARLEDINADRGGADKRCRLFAGLRKSGVVIAEATDVDLYAAIDRAAARLRRALVEATKRQVARDRRHHPRRRMPVAA